MKLSTGLLNAKGEVTKGEVLLQVNETNLREYGTTEDGMKSTCYVLTSPGDVISVVFAITSGTTQVVDLVVDGVLRQSLCNKRAWNIRSEERRVGKECVP